MHLSCLLGLWESAVDLALEINLDLAKEIANKSPEEDCELRKKLWLKIGNIFNIVINLVVVLQKKENSLFMYDINRITQFSHSFSFYHIENVASPSKERVNLIDLK